MSDFGHHPSQLGQSRTPSMSAAKVARLEFSNWAFRWALLLAVFLGLVATSLVRAEKIPPAPARYFNDYAGVAPASTANSLNRELEQFERETSNQLVVAVFPKMDSESSVEDYTVRVAQSWGVGQKQKKNGAVLFVFLESHDVYISVGYGLEPVLTDALCKNIIETQISPRFRAGDFAGGLSSGVHAMMAAARGEYQGTGQTVAEQRRGAGYQSRRGGGLSFPPIIIFVIVMMVVGSFSRRARGNSTRYGRRRGWGSSDDDRFGPGGGFGGLGGFGGFGGGGSSGGSSGGGGGFSGGGGTFGGGGAGGKW